MIRVHFASYSVSFVEYAPKLKNGLYQDQPDGRALYSDDIGYNEVGLVWHSCWKFPIFPVNGFTDTSRGQWSGRNGIVHSNFTQHATCAKLSCVSVCSRLLSTVFWSYKARHYYCHIALPTRYTAPYKYYYKGGSESGRPEIGRLESGRPKFNILKVWSHARR